MLNRVSLLILILLVSACASLEPTSSVNWNSHQNNVLAADVWELQGRLNIRNGQDSDTIAINWQQNEEKYSIRLSGRFGFGAIQINGDENQVTINKGNEPPLTANNLEEIGQAYLGYDFPIGELFYWVRGVPTPQSEYQPEFNEQRLLQSLQQIDKNQQIWQIEYDRYQLSNSIALPGRIRVEQAPYRLTFLIDHWQLL